MKKVELLDIGIPQESYSEQNIQSHLVEEKDIKSIFQSRSPDSHKGSYGHVLVLAGSTGKSGAAGLTALAALRSGCGLCTLALPETCQKAFVAKGLALDKLSFVRSCGRKSLGVSSRRKSVSAHRNNADLVGGHKT